MAGFGPAMTDAARRLTARWERLPDGTVINVAAQMSAVALDIVGRALLGSDLSGDAGQVGRAMDAGQRVATLATFVPLAWGPRSTRALRAVARRVGHTPEGIEGPVGRIVSGRRAAHAGSWRMAMWHPVTGSPGTAMRTSRSAEGGGRA